MILKEKPYHNKKCIKRVKEKNIHHGQNGQNIQQPLIGPDRSRDLNTGTGLSLVGFSCKGTAPSSGAAQRTSVTKVWNEK